jgi:hypothetical protein
MDAPASAPPATPGHAGPGGAPTLFTPGFTLYIALALDEADHQPQQSAIGHAARVTLEGFHQYLESLPIGSATWAEHHAYLQIAIDLAAGRRTRKTTKDKMYRAADDEFEREYERIVSKTAMGAILRGGWKLLIVSGLGALLTELLLRSLDPQHHADPNSASHGWVTLTAAVALMFIGMVYQGAVTQHRVGTIFREHKRAIREADWTYRTEVRREYRQAASMELAVRRQYHPGVEPSMSAAVQELLLQAVVGDDPAPEPVLPPLGTRMGRAMVRMFAPQRSWRRVDAKSAATHEPRPHSTGSTA